VGDRKGLVWFGSISTKLVVKDAEHTRVLANTDNRKPQISVFPSFMSASAEKNCIASLAILGRTNSPLYFKVFEPYSSNSEQNLKFSYIVFTSLDVIEERLGKKSVGGAASTSSTERYLGLLFPTEDYKVYAYVTNTRIKFVLVVEDSCNAKDSELRQFFQRVHNLYVDAVSNPFYTLESTLEFKRFESEIAALVAEGL